MVRKFRYAVFAWCVQSTVQTYSALMNYERRWQESHESRCCTRISKCRRVEMLGVLELLKSGGDGPHLFSDVFHQAAFKDAKLNTAGMWYTLLQTRF
jgi:hypothetical protein